MSVMSNIKLMSNLAWNPIRAGAMQAKTYAGPMGSLAKSLATEVASRAGGLRGIGIRAGIGAGVGAAGGAGYGYTDNRATTRSMIRAGIGGAVLGGIAGAAYGGGVGVMRSMGGENMKNLGANFTLLGRDMRSAGGSIATRMSRIGRSKTMRNTLDSLATRIPGRVAGMNNRVGAGIRSARSRATSGVSQAEYASMVGEL